MGWFAKLGCVVVVGLTASGAMAQVAQTVPTKGQVTRVDEATGRITLRHEPIPNLDMGAMNMVFRVADPAFLQAVKVGDQVTFEADRVDGAITIIKMEKTAP